jgi:hypothetical protein
MKNQREILDFYEKLGGQSWNKSKIEFIDIDTAEEIWEGQTGENILAMMPTDMKINNNLHHAIKKILNCNYSLALNANLEFYFSSDEKVSIGNFNFNQSDNQNYNQSVNRKNASDEEMIKTDSSMLNLDRLKTLCYFDRKFVTMFANWNNISNEQVCYVSLPQVISTLNNKTNCESLIQEDVDYFMNVTSKCAVLHESGLLNAIFKENQNKSEFMQLLTKLDPLTKYAKLEELQNNICFKKNLLYIVYEHLVDKDFVNQLKTQKLVNNQFEVKVTSLILFNTKIENQTDTVSIENRTDTVSIENKTDTVSVENNQTDARFFDENSVYRFYLKFFHNIEYQENDVQILGINLMGITHDTTIMRLFGQEIKILALASILIVVAAFLYLKSIFITTIMILSVGISVRISFFIYRFFFDIDSFLFMNIMAGFLLIVIASHNFYVLLETWYSEKTRVIMENLSDVVEKYYNWIILQNDSFHVKTNASTSTTTEADSATEAADSRINTRSMKKQLSPLVFIHRHFLKSSKCELVNGAEYELNPLYVRYASLTHEQMICVMNGTLRRSAKSIFVSSFATAAAFFTNLIINIPSVQLFCVFIGFCILIHFIMLVSIVPAFVVTCEKFVMPLSCWWWRPSFTFRIEKWLQIVTSHVMIVTHRIISNHLPRLLIKFR